MAVCSAISGRNGTLEFCDIRYTQIALSAKPLALPVHGCQEAPFFDQAMQRKLESTPNEGNQFANSLIQ